MTLFKITLARLGLSQAEAAAYLDVRLDTIKSWSAGRNPVAPFAWERLAELAALQEDAAQASADAWEEAGEPEEVEFGLAADDHEARSLGWPCVGAQLSVAARLWELTGANIRIVPRGSTAATAAAADAHRK